MNTSKKKTNPSPIEFTVNGKPHSIPPYTIERNTTLSTYLRDVSNLKGLKVSCGEGGCGSCTVLYLPPSTRQPASPELEQCNTTTWQPINSCLRLVFTCQGASIITPEGLGGWRSSSSSLSKTGFHTIQTALADGNGVQCGFCSPGWTMAMAGFMLSQQKQQRVGQSDGDDGEPIKLQMEKYLDGNLCRCTGYRPILQSFGELAANTLSSTKAIPGPSCVTERCANATSTADTDDIEDIHKNLCLLDSKAKCSRSKYLQPSHHQLFGHKTDITTDQLLQQVAHDTFYRPETLKELFRFLIVLCKNNHDRLDPRSIQIVAGHTGLGGVVKYFNNTAPLHAPDPVDDHTIQIDINGIAALCAVESSKDEQKTGKFYNTHVLTLGPCITIDEMIHILKRHAGNETLHPLHVAARHLSYVGNSQLRSVGTIGGNVMLAWKYPSFHSDVVLVLIGLGAVVSCLDMQGNRFSLSLVECMSTDFFKEVPLFLFRIALPFTPAAEAHIEPNRASHKTIAQSYKVAPRSSGAHTMVSAYFSTNIISATNNHDDEKESIVTFEATQILFVGVTNRAFVAKRCASEIMSSTKETAAGLNDEVVSNIIQALEQDMQETIEPFSDEFASSEYRTSLAKSLVYKFLLYIHQHLQAEQAGPIHTLHSDSFLTDKPISGLQSFDVDYDTYPVTAPLPKKDARLLAAGEGRYVTDEIMPSNGVFGALVISTRARAILQSIDGTDALDMDGVIDILTSCDIPGMNSISHATGQDANEERLFVQVGEEVPCVGACIGLVVATTKETAQLAARHVKLIYECREGEDDKSPILTLEAAMKAGSVFPGCIVDPLMRGDVEIGLNQASKKLNGMISTGGQMHFYLENNCTIATPNEGGSITVRTATQSVSATQTLVSDLLGISAHKVNVVMKRTGGAFGGKITRSFFCAGASAIAAAKLDRPVFVENDRNTDFAMMGGREPIIAEYTVGFEPSGHVTALSLTFHCDSGCTKDESLGDLALAVKWADHCYYIPNFRSEGILYRTNLPSNTSCRAPGTVQACYAVDAIFFRVAQKCGISMQRCQELNFYREGQAAANGDILTGMTMDRVWNSILDDANVCDTQRDIAAFNAENRWKKRALSITPCKYGLAGGNWQKNIARISIFAVDGSIEINHSGVEMGQGIDMKVAAVCAMALGGLPLGMITTGEKSSNAQPNATMTAASSTSESCCQAMLDACSTIMQRLAPYKEIILNESKSQLLSPQEVFVKAVKAADKDRVCLSAKGWSAPISKNAFQYYAYCAAAVQVELDVLTGQIQLLSAHISYDCGKQLNAAVDVGQIEGGFVMGLGYFLTESVIHDLADGKLVSNNTWKYKPLAGSDMPRVFNVRLLKDSFNEAPGCVLRSKSTGEPPLVCASAAHFAVREAIIAARRDIGATEDFQLDIPATVAHRHVACMVDSSQFKLPVGM